MAHTLRIIGIGPGNPDYVVPIGLKRIAEAKVLVGSERALQDFARDGQQCYPVTGKLSELALWIEQQLTHDDVVVLVSGDTGYYSLLPYLKKKFPTYPLEVIPGISSMMFAFARLGEVWQNADLMSFHGRIPPADKLRYEEGRTLGFLTDKEHNPSAIARILMDEHGWPKETTAAACERLSYEDERIERATLGDIAELPGFYHSVLVVMG